jgi:hypothetical protein
MAVSMVKPQVDASDMLELFLEWTPHDPRMYVGIPNFGPFLEHHNVSTLNHGQSQQNP